ncbi:MAG: hypothetical protein DME22_15495 [Verrucomicrobia bacterium]|nr:MAG: hypothetical protein DME22_15495 [Verrucomicrobiota bacterium]
METEKSETSIEAERLRQRSKAEARVMVLGGFAILAGVVVLILGVEKSVGGMLVGFGIGYILARGP